MLNISDKYKQYLIKVSHKKLDLNNTCTHNWNTVNTNVDNALC